ncbi:Biopolymer transport protein ExbD/TolR [Bacteroides coprosuis DSM 18011]|mgnify:CR=1 FL=1|uniref:Biopolymer transport protein ExbD/TolR n=1 Tax=Bacteroides coprosuis DSM 18011 TaxID=679937 RepID=F3ZP25_9BACE|nr:MULTISPECIES: biopolymer transporter ExbD [Bacteroides]EGJ72598.1 Biopolymer transport protein ExbD/TolR [Bacteroides coprosuis DSM 18011]HJD92622.1 biopolymer transporter ExbD [Bacteroides coprosuis]
MAKVKKHDVFIDMTAMSDVTVLLLTFFMLTSTFLPKEPVTGINAPASVKDIKVPDYNVMNILIDLKGKVYLNIDRPEVKLEALDRMSKQYGVTFSDQQKKVFVEQPYIGVPISRLPALLDLPMSDQDAHMRQYGIPSDSISNQLTDWIQIARDIDSDMKITLKADQTTPYPIVEKVMKDLVKIKANRYSLVTVLKGAPDGF